MLVSSNASKDPETSFGDYESTMTTANSPEYELNNGIEMPAVGLGVFHSEHPMQRTRPYSHFWRASELIREATDAVEHGAQGLRGTRAGA
jgi:hypothetical protein